MPRKDGKRYKEKEEKEKEINSLKEENEKTKEQNNKNRLSHIPYPPIYLPRNKNIYFRNNF